jgi:DNA-binding NarL/FixJ family response regulator
MIRVLMGDSQRSFAEALALRLDAEAGFQVMAVAVRAEEVRAAVRSHPIDVAVLSADGDDGAFLQLGRELLAARPGLHLVAVSGDDAPAIIARAVRQGFRGWVPRDVGVAALLNVLRSVHAGETCVPPLLLSRLLEQLLQEEEEEQAARAPFTSLTARETELLHEVCKGATRAEIAERLAISPNTVRTHMQSILSKLGAHTTLEVIALARRAGIH